MTLLQTKLDNLDHKPVNTFVVPFLYPDYIKGCVESIWKHCDPKDHRLIVVNNQYELGYLDHEWLAERSHLYIRSYRNLGCAKAWNTGLRLVDTKYVTIMGDDTRIIHKNWWPELLDYMRVHGAGVFFCHPCHLTQPSKVRGELEPPEFTDAMWEEAKERSGDMTGRFNALVFRRKMWLGEYHWPFNENLYPCEQLDGWFKECTLEKFGIHYEGVHLPVWHMRAMTYQRGNLPLHDKGKSNPDYKQCPFEIRQL